MLAARGLTFDAWLFHPQIPELTDLARAFPGASIILDHLGGPLGIGPYAGRRDAYFPSWRADMAELATCPNVTVKLGGMAMPINGWDWHKTGAPDSTTFANAQGDWYRAAIDLFGPDRCMFESNFPVDRASLSYRTLWNGLKRIAAPYSEAEKELMFRGTAARVYGVED
jgi:predicted TIM-barrel fold metal-dependent hydrolase